MTIVSALLITVERTEHLDAIELTADDGGGAVTHLGALYTALDAQTVDVIRLPDGVDAWVDDEAGLTGVEPNFVLTAMVSILAGGVPMRAMLRGGGVFAATDGEGMMVSLNAVQRAAVEGAHKRALMV